MKRTYEAVALVALGLGVGGIFQQYQLGKRVDRVEGTHLFIQSMQSGATEDWKEVVHEIVGENGEWVRVERLKPKKPISKEEARERIWNRPRVHYFVVH
jgi:hypothetical protein